MTGIAIQVLVFGIMAWTIPQFAELYEGAMPDQPLPGLTVMFLRTGPTGCVAVMVIMILALVTTQVLIRRRRARAWTSVGFAGIGGLILVVYIIAVFKPLVGYTGGGLGG